MIKIKSSSLYFIISSIALSILLSASPAFAEHHTTFSKVLDVQKASLQNTMSDVRNYERVFPDYVKSVDIIQASEKKALADVSMGFGFIPINVQVQHNTINDDISMLEVVTGDLKGTQIITTLKKTWGYNGIEGMATTVDVDMSLQVSGFLGMLGVVNESLILYALDSSLYSLQEYSNGNQIELEKSHPKKKR